MTGSSIAGRDAAAWVTDFLNAAYYRRPVDERRVDDMRLAFSILTTYWYRKAHGRLRITDLPAFHRAFGAHRFDKQDAGRGLLSREQLLLGAAGLIGDWFPDAYHDDERRGWGIAFPTVEEKAAYEPRRRRKLAQVGELTPESAPPEQRIWHTYPPVRMPSAEAVIAALTKPETWPDYASEIGRFVGCDVFSRRAGEQIVGKPGWSFLRFRRCRGLFLRLACGFHAGHDAIPSRRMLLRLS